MGKLECHFYTPVCQSFCSQGGGVHGRGCAWRGFAQRGHAWHGEGVMHGRDGYAWQGACMAGACMVCFGGGGYMAGRGMHRREECVVRGMHGRGEVWQERWLLQRPVRILLQCILVLTYLCGMNKWGFPYITT